MDDFREVWGAGEQLGAGLGSPFKVPLVVLAARGCAGMFHPLCVACPMCPLLNQSLLLIAGLDVIIKECTNLPWALSRSLPSLGTEFSLIFTDWFFIVLGTHTWSFSSQSPEHSDTNPDFFGWDRA